MTRRDALLTTCAFPALAQTVPGKFEKLADDYIAYYLQSDPEAATYLGEHRYDDRLSDVSPAAREHDLARHREFLKQAEALGRERLDPVSRIDLSILRNQIEANIWHQTVLCEYEWNPMAYNPGAAIYYLIERQFAPLPQRLKSLQGRLEAIPAFLATARANLKTSTKIHTETAISQIQGTINLVTKVLDGAVTRVPESKSAIAPAQARAADALKDWREWLQRNLLPRASKDFRIGPELYSGKLRYALNSGLSSDAIRTRGEKDLRNTQALMYDTALQLGGNKNTNRAAVIRAALDQLAATRPTAGTIVSLAESDLKEATAFVRSHNLMTVFDSPLRIVEMPEFQRGVAVASCASPGPLEKSGTTFFNISPPPSNWTAAQVESYFREYNNAMTKNLVVHEAMPGHYLQRAHANRFQAPTLTRAIFSSGTFTEGWAVYAEKLMANAGYGGPAVRMQQLKMRLRVIINALIDQGIHARNMTEQQVMDLMMNEGFQEKSEAAGKWRRAQLTSTQLSTYYVGTTELDALRESWVRKHGPIRDEKVFSDRMLSFGSPAPRYVRELMGV